MHARHPLRFVVHITLILTLRGMSTAAAASLTVDANTAYVAADGLCALVEAIDNANDDAATHPDCPAGTGADTILLTRDVVLDGTQIFAFDGPNGLPSVATEMNLKGNGYSIRRDAGVTDFRILHVADTGSLSLDQVTLSSGLISSGFDNGGGIYNAGALIVSESVVRDNRVESVFPSGGGIYNAGVLSVINSSIVRNIATDDTFSSGGGIYSALDSVLTLTNATLRHNEARVGGGLWTGGDTTMNNTVFENNSAHEIAGAALLTGTLDPTSYRIYNSSFRDNTASEGGGAIVNGNDDTSIFGSTFAGNRVTDTGVGGAIQNSNGNMSITNSLFDGNQTLSGAIGGAIGNLSLGGVDLVGSIVRNNHSDTLAGGLYTSLAEFRVTDSLIAANHAQNGGGFAAGASNLDSFFIERSSIIDNVASNLGGGLYLVGNLSTSFITNSTISGNEAQVLGGGVALNGGGRLDIRHTAVINNSTNQFVNGIGGLNLFAGTASVGSNIIANNATGDCSATNSSNSLDYNITTGPPGGIPADRWCAFIPLQPNDLTATDPLVGPLAFNGNLGPTHLLQPASPAVDAIPFDCPPELDGVDQRGVGRPAGSCDVGPISDQAVQLPEVYFASASSTIDDEGSFIGALTVDLLVDNTSGTLAAPAMDLNLYVSIRGTAAPYVDYSASVMIPTRFTLNAGNWPLPGTVSTIPINLMIIDDELKEGDETVDLNVSLTGPGVLGTQTDHLVTIVDDDLTRFSCNGFYPPLHQALEINRKSKQTIPVKLDLFDELGLPQRGSNIPAPPVITVALDGTVYGDSSRDDADVMPVGKSNAKNMFAFNRAEQFWNYRLDSGQFPQAGTYTVTVRSGDEQAYTIDPTCTQIFTRTE